MGVKKFLLVCEGPTDIEVLQAISAGIQNVNGNSIEIVPLSPQRDRTSGLFPPQGWTAVRDWCKSNREKSPLDVSHLPLNLQEIALRKNWKNLIGASSAEGIIIQIDTDIATEIHDLPQSFSSSGMDRKTYTRSALLHWLSIPTCPAGSLFLVLSTHSTESWILACHEPSDPIFSDLPLGFNYEELSDVEARLLAKGMAKARKRGKDRLKKTAQIYKAYGIQIVASLQKVRGRCAEANAYCSFLEIV